MANKEKQKRRLNKALNRRHKKAVARSWRNIFVKSGFLK